MIGGLLLGAVGGFAAVSAIGRARRRRWRGGMRGPRLFHLARALKLDPAQRDAAREIVGGVKRSLIGLRGGRERAMRAAAEALSSETFDRARVEAAASSELAALDGVKEELVQGLAKLHALLTPEQRARLASLTAAPAPAPYR
jgi:Spy/CpxP family protein refolding chaperone